jgi:glycosyltransferase involved in cell wall biosynthesis
VDLVVVNSEFTKTNYTRKVRNAGFRDLKVEIISPPLSDFASDHNLRNPRQIISVGQFSAGYRTNNQHVLIEAFRSLLNDYPEASLVLAGSLAPGSENRAYLKHCLELAKGLPVSFHIDADSDELQKLVRTSSVYWLGTGFGVNVRHNPELCEHFGITLVEAMGAGVIPIVVGSGGPDEIVDFGVSGFKFQTIDGLLRRTGLVFDLDPESQAILRKNARKRFETYLEADFSKKWISIIEEVV